MTTALLIALLLLGVSTIVWGSMGLARLLAPARPLPGAAPASDEVAVVVAARNEALVIEHTIRSASALVPSEHVFVVSDGSVDDTAAVARAAGATVLELERNRGKAGAIAAAVKHFALSSRFPVVLLLDADTQLSPDYLETGLPAFADPAVVAVAGRAATLDDPNRRNWFARLLIAYRERVYVTMQYLHKFGQAAPWLSVVNIVPGFASMYRSSALDRIEIDAPGLAIEDFNMTFEVHAKRLGRIAFHPHAAIAYTQDPDTLHDYVKQMRRWNIGFWQTVRKHGWGVGRLRLPLVLLVADLLVSSGVVLLTVPVIALSGAADVVLLMGAPQGSPADLIADAAPLPLLVLGVVVPDYLLTVLVTAVTRRPSYLLLGLLFPVLRVVDAAVCLRALALAGSNASTGTWRSPRRRAAASLHADPSAPGLPTAEAGAAQASIATR